MKYRNLTIFLLLGVLFSCGQQKIVTKSISKIYQENSLVTIKSWEIAWEEIYDGSGTYDLVSHDSDTIFFLDFDYLIIPKDSVIVTEYTFMKAYFDNDAYNVINLTSIDTSFYYLLNKSAVTNLSQAKYRITDFDDINFVKGKFEYMYYYRLFNSNEESYYKLHRDSLMQLRGNPTLLVKP